MPRLRTIAASTGLSAWACCTSSGCATRSCRPGGTPRAHGRRRPSARWRSGQGRRSRVSAPRCRDFRRVAGGRRARQKGEARRAYGVGLGTPASGFVSRMKSSCERPPGSRCTPTATDPITHFDRSAVGRLVEDRAVLLRLGFPIRDDADLRSRYVHYLNDTRDFSLDGEVAREQAIVRDPAGANSENEEDEASRSTVHKGEGRTTAACRSAPISTRTFVLGGDDPRSRRSPARPRLPTRCGVTSSTRQIVAPSVSPTDPSDYIPSGRGGTSPR